MIITIDGPTASGKSTIARMLAQELGYYHLNSGLVFRALAYLLITQAHYSIDMLAHPQDTDLDIYLNPERLLYRFSHAQAHVLFDGIDITPELKNGDIDQASSLVSSNATVRNRILTLLHTIAAHHDSVVDGRDTGSVIFPHADIKFYLTASAKVRAQRWVLAQKELGNSYSFAQAMNMITQRDERDMQRTISPLIIPMGAHVIDNSNLNQQQTIDFMMRLIKEAGL